MPKIFDPIEPFDVRTSRSICDAVGERLRQSLRPHALRPSPYLLELLEELRRQEEEDGITKPPR
jgi:hypothetical protein